MVSVDIDRELYNDIKKMIMKYKYSYPSIKFFVQKAVYNEIQSSKKNLNNDVESFYAKIKELLAYNPELKSRINRLYDSEVKKIKDEEKKFLIRKM